MRGREGLSGAARGGDRSAGRGVRAGRGRGRGGERGRRGGVKGAGEEGGGRRRRRQRKRWWVGGPPAGPHHSAAKIAGNDGRAAASTTKTAENSAFRGAESRHAPPLAPADLFGVLEGSEPVSSVYSITAHDHTSAAAPSCGSPDDTSGAMYFLRPPARPAGGSVALAAKECEKSHA